MILNNSDNNDNGKGNTYIIFRRITIR